MDAKPVQRAGAAYKKAAGALSAATLDRARNAVTYRIYGCEDARSEQYEDALDRYEKTAVRSNVWQSALPPLYLAASEAGVLFILWFGAKNVLGTGWSRWDIAAFTTFLSCFTKLVVKSSKVAKLFNAVQKAEVSWKRIKPLMKQPEQLEPLQVPQAADVTLKDLAFAYGDVPIFSGLNLTAHPGDIIGITGPVACGKSTLGRVFLCEAPYAGSVRFGKTELSALTPRQVSATVGYLGHDPELSADTVRSNVLCGGEQDASQRHSVALVVKSTQSEFFRSVFAGAEAAAAEYNIELSIAGPETEEDYETQNQMVADATESSDDDIPLICGDISMKIGQHEVMVRGENVFFPLKEFELLEYLMQNKGRVMTRHQLIDRIWGSDYVGDTKTLDVHVKRVRSKIEEDPAHPKYLTTVRGLGYKIDVPAE